jgi:hypothetical protein
MQVYQLYNEKQSKYSWTEILSSYLTYSAVTLHCLLQSNFLVRRNSEASNSVLPEASIEVLCFELCKCNNKDFSLIIMSLNHFPPQKQLGFRIKIKDNRGRLEG